MGQIVGASNARAEEPRSNPVTLDNLFATVLYVLFDLPALRSHTGLPRNIASLIDRSQPISQLI